MPPARHSSAKLAEQSEGGSPDEAVMAPEVAGGVGMAWSRYGGEGCEDAHSCPASSNDHTEVVEENNRVY